MKTKFKKILSFFDMFFGFFLFEGIMLATIITLINMITVLSEHKIILAIITTIIALSNPYFVFRILFWNEGLK